jgi:hypothetical protein
MLTMARAGATKLGGKELLGIHAMIDPKHKPTLRLRHLLLYSFGSLMSKRVRASFSGTVLRILWVSGTACVVPNQ